MHVLLHACNGDKFVFSFIIATIFVKLRFVWKNCIHSSFGGSGQDVIILVIDPR